MEKGRVLAVISSKRIRRQDRILDKLELNPAIRVNELAQALGVSSETIRRDLAELDDTADQANLRRRSSYKRI